MTTAQAALVVAVIGLSGTLATTALTARARRHEAYVQELRQRTAEVFKEAFVIQHAMEWVTWHATHEPKAVTGELKQNYAAEVHDAFPALQGAMAAAAALSTDVYHEMRPILDGLYTLEGKVARALVFVPAAASSPVPERERAEAHDSGHKAIEGLRDLHGQVAARTKTCLRGSARLWRLRFTPHQVIDLVFVRHRDSLQG